MLQKIRSGFLYFPNSRKIVKETGQEREGPPNRHLSNIVIIIQSACAEPASAFILPSSRPDHQEHTLTYTHNIHSNTHTRTPKQQQRKNINKIPKTKEKSLDNKEKNQVNNKNQNYYYLPPSPTQQQQPQQLLLLLLQQLQQNCATATPLSTPASSPCGTKYHTYSSIFFANFREQQMQAMQERERQLNLRLGQRLRETAINCHGENNNAEADDSAVASELEDNLVDQDQEENGNGNRAYMTTDTSGTLYYGTQSNKIRITENPLPEPVSS